MNKNYLPTTMAAHVNALNTDVVSPLPPKLSVIFILSLLVAMLLSATGYAAIAPQPLTGTSSQSLPSCEMAVGGVISSLVKRGYSLKPVISEKNRSAAFFIPNNQNSTLVPLFLGVLRTGTGETMPIPEDGQAITGGECSLTEGGTAAWILIGPKLLEVQND